MKITADTNLLLRAAVGDDPSQARSAAIALRNAERIVVTVATLCEFVWVLRRLHKRSATDVARSIRSLVDGAKVTTNRPAVDAGLAILENGGDFADGVIAYEGNWLGADEFVSFDKQAVSLLKAQGKAARLLS